MKILLIYILIMGAGIALGYKTKFSSKGRTRDLFQKGCLLIILLCLAAMAGSFLVVLLLRMALEGRKSARSGEEEQRW